MSSPLAPLKFILLKIPLIFKTILLHTLSLSPTTRKWNLRTELIIAMLRDFVRNSPPSTISEQQEMFLQDPGVKGEIWVSKVTMPAPPEDGLRNLLFKAIKALRRGSEQYCKPTTQPMGAELVGYRSGVSARTPEPSISELEKYKNLVSEVQTDFTLLYFHGGSYYLMDPCSTRPTTSKYAALTRGRIFSVRYRLAPQDPFPSALLDALIAYLSLLYPPPGAFHEPVPASRIVICGDSAGGNLSKVLLQTLLQIHRAANTGEVPTVMFHGAVVPLPLPAGVALNSPSLDLTRSMQWSEANAKYDYLPLPSFSPALSPPCRIWPTDPPRVDLFCEGSALCHPLVSPIAAASWVGSPPIFIVCGEELLTDECKTFAQTVALQGVTVVWEQYEAMPHCFAFLLERSVEAKESFDCWTRFVKGVVEKPDAIVTRAEFISANSLERRLVDIYRLINLGDGDILKLMESARQSIVERLSLAL